MLADGYLVGDGSWTLRVMVTDLNVEKSLRVKGDMHIGGVMLNLVEEIDIANDWSDHALWWPQKNMWLKRNRSTLDMYGVTADAILEFTPMHKVLRVQLPDLRYIDCRVDFSVKVLNAIIHLCKDLGIRYPEELSFQKPLEPDDIKHNYTQQAAKRKVAAQIQPDTNTFVANHNNTLNSSNGSADRSFGNSTLNRSNGPIGTPIGSVNTWRPGDQSFNSIALNGSSYSPLHDSLNLQNDSTLATSPLPSQEARMRLLKPKSLVERARLNVSWLNSSLSIMEQGIRQFDCLLLRFKFFSFYDLNPKYDAVRINQLYEQAKWQLLNEEIDCTEEEMLMFAALQLQVNLQCNNPMPCEVLNPEDDIDAALTDLQTTLEGTSITSPLNDITQIPEISDYLRFLKPSKFTLRRFKRYWFICKDLQLYLYKSSDEVGSDYAHHINLKGCEVSPDVNISQGKYGIRIEVPSESGMSEVKIMCDNENKYAKWMAACRLAAKGKTLADSTYEGEVKSILSLLSMQQPAMAPAISPSDLNIEPDDYMANRFVKKFRGKLTQRILEAHANVKDLSLVDAKMSYIKAWQSLPDYGVSLFIVHFQTSKKEDLLGVAYNRLMRMDIGTGDHIKTWRFNTMKAWNINWEVKHMMVQFEEDKNIIFSCLSADCKVIHEFIGGYIYMSMRSKDASQTLNEELFHKLTGGWV